MKTNHPCTFKNSIIFICVAVLVVVVFVRYRNIFNARHSAEQTEILVPGLESKPAPKEITFHDCPPEGNGGDVELNLLKNRVDDGNYNIVKIESVLNLPWPHDAERRKRREWPEDAKSEIRRNEGDPITIEGYLIRVKEEGPESPNCHIDDPDSRDFHIWLAASPEEDQSRAIVVEITPRVRSFHAAWTLSRVRKIIHDRDHVRVSGWLLFDQEHPDQVDKTRGTLWEIHPIMNIETDRGGRWTSIDHIPG